MIPIPPGLIRYLPHLAVGVAVLILFVAYRVQVNMLEGQRDRAVASAEKWKDASKAWERNFNTVLPALKRQNAAVEKWRKDASAMELAGQKAAEAERRRNAKLQTRLDAFLRRPVQGSSEWERVVDVKQAIRREEAR